MLQNYTKIFNKIKRQIVFITDDDVFVMGKYFMRIKIETSDVLKKNVSVCVIAINSIFEENGVYYPQITLYGCSYDYEDCDD